MAEIMLAHTIHMVQNHVIVEWGNATSGVSNTDAAAFCQTEYGTELASFHSQSEWETVLTELAAVKDGEENSTFCTHEFHMIQIGLSADMSNNNSAWVWQVRLPSQPSQDISHCIRR
jgi:hypothetical protein